MGAVQAAVLKELHQAKKPENPPQSVPQLISQRILRRAPHDCQPCSSSGYDSVPFQSYP